MKMWKVIEAAAYKTEHGPVVGFYERPRAIKAADESVAYSKAFDQKRYMPKRKDMLSWNWYVTEVK